jgi:hypothetical protein
MLSQPVTGATDAREAFLSVNEVGRALTNAFRIVVCLTPPLNTAGKCSRCLETHHRVCMQRSDRRLLTPHHRLLTSKHEDSVRLYCTVPTWSPSSEICMYSCLASPYDWVLLTRICQVLIFMTFTLCDLDLCTLSTIWSTLCVNLVYAEMDGDLSTTLTFSEL